MSKQKKLINLGIVIPKNTACYRNNIAITSTYINWFNPLTYPYLIGCLFYLVYGFIRYGKQFADRL